MEIRNPGAHAPSSTMKLNELQMPLAHATKRRHMDVVALMLDYGADPSASGRAIWPGVLESAIGSGDIEMVKLLLNRGIGVHFQQGEPHCKPNLGVNALESAVRFPSIFRLLIDRGALNSVAPLSVKMILKKVVQSGNVSLINVLSDKGISLDVRDGERLLFAAAEGGSDMLEFLSLCGVLLANPEKKNYYWLRTYGIEERNLGVLNFLLKNGFDQDLPMALVTAAAAVTDHEITIQIFDTLLRHGANIHEMHMHCFGCSKSSYCPCPCKEEQLSVVQYLLDKGANPLLRHSARARGVLSQAAERNYRKLRHVILQAIIDMPGISLDEIQENLLFAEAEKLLSRSSKLVNDYYWRRIHMVP